MPKRAAVSAKLTATITDFEYRVEVRIAQKGTGIDSHAALCFRIAAAFEEARDEVGLAGAFHVAQYDGLLSFETDAIEAAHKVLVAAIRRVDSLIWVIS